MTANNPTSENKHSHPGLRPVPIAASIFLGIGLWLAHGELYPSLTEPLWLTGILLVTFGLLTLVFLTIPVLKSPGAIILTTVIPLAIGIGTGSLLALLEHLLTYIWFPYPLDDGEGFCLNQAVLIASGQPLYQPIDTAPYIVTNYPPVFPWLLSIFTDPGNISFIPGRLISVISTFVIALTAWFSVKKITGNNIAGLISGFLILASPIMYFWGALLRVDLLATALGMAAFYIAVTAKGNKIYWTLPFLLAAFFTRQSSVEVFVSIIAAIAVIRNNSGFLSENRKKVLFFSFLWLAGIVGGLILLQIITGGEFWKHTVEYTKTRFFPQRSVSNLFFIVQTHAILFLISLFALPSTFKSNSRRIFGLFFIMSFLTAMLSGKVGSDMNYFLNLLIAASMLGGIFLSDMSALVSKTNPPRFLIPALLLIPAALYQCGFIEGNRANSFHPDIDAVNYAANVVETLEAVNGPVLIEDEGFCLLSGHEVIFNPFIMSEMAREGYWDQTPLIQAIENKEFNLIMLRFYVADPMHDDRPGVGGFAGWDRFTDEMEDAILRNYELDPDSLHIYRNFEIYMRRRWFIYQPVGTVLESRTVTEGSVQPGNPE